MPSRTFPGSYAALEALGKFVSREAKAAGLDDKEIYAVQLAVDEAATNIIDHAYGGENKGEFECIISTTGSEIQVTLKDHGRPFVPEEVPELPLGASLEKIVPGGVGLFLMKKMMDEVHFEFHKNENIVTLIKRSKS